MESLFILCLVMLAVACCFMFWFSVMTPVGKCFQYEHVIAEFRREISRWEHDQCR